LKTVQARTLARGQRIKTFEQHYARTSSSNEQLASTTTGIGVNVAAQSPRQQLRLKVWNKTQRHNFLEKRMVPLGPLRSYQNRTRRLAASSINRTAPGRHGRAHWRPDPARTGRIAADWIFNAS
jgi:hypothetical protein